MRDIRKKLEEIRKVTGSYFSAKNGYDLRKGLSKRRIKTIEKYYEVLEDLTSREHVEYKPRKGEKREAFAYSGQSHTPRFDRAFIHKVDPDADLTFVLDKHRPKGSRFISYNKKTGQSYYHIPADAFLGVQDDDLEEAGEEAEDFYEDVLREYAEDAELFLINAGNNYMWGSSGQHNAVAKKVADLFRNYGAGNFDPTDKNSHFYGNWFNGVTAFTRAADAYPLIRERYTANEKRKEERHILTDDKIRVLRSGDLGLFRNGRLYQTVRRGDVEPYAPKPKRRR